HFWSYLFYYIAIMPLGFFFFQAEDGIRDRNVTGVQTCALPICLLPCCIWSSAFVLGFFSCMLSLFCMCGRSSEVSSCLFTRSEERRVGKECWSRWREGDGREKEMIVTRRGSDERDGRVLLDYET